MHSPELRPRTVGEILDAAFKLYTANIRKLLLIATVVFIPIAVIQLIVTAGSGLGQIDILTGDFLADPSAGLPSGLFAFLAGSVALGLIGVIGSLFVQGASIKLFAGAYHGVDESWQSSIRFGIDNSLRILGTALISSIVAGVALFPFVAPGVWLWTSWYVAIPALLIEGAGVTRALSRSFALVRQRFWPVLGTGLLAWLISQVVVQLIGVVVTLFGLVPRITDAASTGGLGSGLLGLSTLASAVGSIVTVPFLAAVAVSLYFDLRVRFEGFDLEMLGRSAVESGEVPEGFEPEPGPDDPFGLD